MLCWGEVGPAPGQLIREKCKQDYVNIAASAADTAAGKVPNKHVATTIGNLHGLLVAPAELQI